MEITLEKIELVKDRTGVSYKEAKEALEENGSSVVDAIIAIEEAIGTKPKFAAFDSACACGQNVAETVKGLIKKGNVSKIVVKKDDEIVLNIPVTVGLVGTVLAPVAMVVAAITAFGTKCVVEVVKEDGSIIDVSEMANETFDEVCEKGAVIADEVREKGADVYNSVLNKTSEALSKVKKDKDSSDFSFSDDLAGADGVTTEEKQ
jgi:hypothetical protein